MAKLIVAFALLRKRLKTAKIQLEYTQFIPPKEHSLPRLERTTREGNSHFLKEPVQHKITQFGVKWRVFFAVHKAVQIVTTRL